MKKLLIKFREDDSGLTMMVVMMLLFLLTILGMSMYFMSSTDLKISSNVYSSTRAFYAAESGINEAVARLNLPSSHALYDGNMFDPKPYDDADSLAWTYDLSTAPSWTGTMDNGDTYEVTIEHKKLDTDSDGSYDTVVTYDTGYYPNLSRPGPGDGYAVEVIRSVGKSVDGEVVMVLEISKAPLDVKAKGAITANSDVDLTGNFNVDGRDHDASGNLTGNPGMPGVLTTTGHTVGVGGSADTEGSPPILEGAWDPTDAAWGPYPKSPLEVLGLDPTDTTDSAFLDPANCDYYGTYDGSIGMNNGPALEGITYITGDYPGPKANGSGILIIHNPDFDPCIYEAAELYRDSGDTTHPCFSDATVTDGTNVYSLITHMYDPLDPTSVIPRTTAYADDAQYQPAKLGNFTSNGTFKGLIIADYVDKIAGTPTVIGAIVSLSSVDVQHYGTGNADILYSSEVLDNVTMTGYSTKVSWFTE